MRASRLDRAERFLVTPSCSRVASSFAGGSKTALPAIEPRRPRLPGFTPRNVPLVPFAAGTFFSSSPSRASAATDISPASSGACKAAGWRSNASSAAIGCPQSAREITDAAARLHRGARQRGGVAAGSKGAAAGVPVVGYLFLGSPDPIANRLAAFLKGLSEGGFVEGRNVMIEYRYAHNDIDRLPELAADLVRRRVAVIAVLGSTPRHSQSRPRLRLFRSSSRPAAIRSNQGWSPALIDPKATSPGSPTWPMSCCRSCSGCCRSWCRGQCASAYSSIPVAATCGIDHQGCTGGGFDCRTPNRGLHRR